MVSEGRRTSQCSYEPNPNHRTNNNAGNRSTSQAGAARATAAAASGATPAKACAAVCKPEKLFWLSNASHVISSYIGYRAHSSCFESFMEDSKDYASATVSRRCGSASLQD